MSKIIIEKDDYTSNYDALEAVGRFIMDNYRKRFQEEYKSEREINVSSGQKLIVFEWPEGFSSSGDFLFKVKKA